MGKRVAFYTLGCKLNFSETSTICRTFEERGFKKVAFTDNPDVFVINTCSVTENADKKCKKIVKEAKKISPDAFVAIIGCYAQLKPKEISEIPGVDAVLGAAEKFRLTDILDDFARQTKTEVHISAINQAHVFNDSYSLNDRTRSFLKVQDGCDYNCTFCTIPLARGESRSNTIEQIVSSAHKIAASGVKEIVLTGVNIGDFGIRNGKRENRFIDLIKKLDEIEGIDRFRISSCEPNLLHNQIIEFIFQSRRFVPHFHIPLQSGSNKILKLMKRRYNRELYADRVKYIKQLSPNCCIGVDVIAGFPGEQDDDFMETYQFLNELDISYLHVFPYSERNNTEAAKMKGVVPLEERHKRSKMLRILSEKKRRSFYESQLGCQAVVLFENDVKDGMMHGFTENHVRVKAKYNPLLINKIKKVTLISIAESGHVETEEVQEAWVH